MTDRPPEIVLVRHGETEWSRDGRHTGHTDLPLTAGGADQAELLGRCLGDCRFASVLTSPLQRAIETCRRAGLGALAEIRPELAEWDYGAYEGRRTVEIRAEAHSRFTLRNAEGYSPFPSRIEAPPVSPMVGPSAASRLAMNRR